MKIRYASGARKEFFEAMDYYESIEPGLGGRFVEEVEMALDQIARNPKVPRFRKRGYRRINLHVFPYYLPYVIEQEIIWVMAVAHSSRKPHYWTEREIP